MVLSVAGGCLPVKVSVVSLVLGWEGDTPVKPNLLASREAGQKKDRFHHHFLLASQCVEPLTVPIIWSPSTTPS